MTDEATPSLTDKDFKQAEEYPTLGPVYFAARRMSEGAVKAIEDIDLSGAIKTFTDEAYEKILSATHDWLLSNLESNLQGDIQETVETIIKALIGGKKWAMRRYALADKYEDERYGIREAICKHIGDEVAAQRIADLEAEIARRDDLINFLRGC